MSPVDWDSTTNELMINPRMPSHEQDEAKALLDRYSHLKGHVWIATSGSSSLKWTALSKKAFLINAQAVNTHLECTSADVWINPLPSFHVGGLSIWARSHLSGAKVVQILFSKWDIHSFYESLVVHRGTLTALVPTQVYDLVSATMKPPSSLRAVIVGGGGLPPELYFKARELGWNLLPSYGMTECCSQVATAALNSLNKRDFPKLKILDHAAVEIRDELIAIKSDALLTGFVMNGSFVDPKDNGWYKTDDRGTLNHDFLEVFGRNGAFVKIGGESVDLNRLENVLQGIKLSIKSTVDTALIAMPDERLGHVIHLAVAKDNAQSVVEQFNAKVHPFERIRHIHFVDSIPRTALNKVYMDGLRKKLKWDKGT